MSGIEDSAGGDFYISSYEKYTEQMLTTLFDLLIQKIKGAEEDGFKKVFLQFESTLDSYEDHTTGPVEVRVRGYRDKTYYEMEEELKHFRIQSLATKLGVTFYEASVIEPLMNSGKIELK